MTSIDMAIDKIKELGGYAQSGINWILGSMPDDREKVMEFVSFLRHSGLEFRTPCKCGLSYRINFREGN